ncbi:glycosyl hydrolase [Aromatoleum evansii]|nr:glycosyl hydrolase [Aromatoleum evansii]
MSVKRLGATICLATGICALYAVQASAAVEQSEVRISPAVISQFATRAAILGAATAGQRVVAVGSYGTVLLSDDGGQSFRQARSVPVSSTLTSVSFVDEKHGWAVGHWGMILATEDGGDTWAVQRTDLKEDRPLFSVHFFDQNEGVAVGLWSLILRTGDGGKTWDRISVQDPDTGGESDRNLFKLFAAPSGTLFVSAERGSVLRSDDRGRTWSRLDTPYKGSLWSGLVMKDGTLLVGGLRGSLYRSRNGGSSWDQVRNDAHNSITDMVETSDRVVAVGLNGVRLESRDGGMTFVASQRDDRLSLTAAVIAPSGDVVTFSKTGIVGTGTSSAVSSK